MRKIVFVFCLFLLSSLGIVPAGASAEPAATSLSLAGEAFGKPVTKEEFDFAYRTTTIFSVTGKEAAQEEEQRIEAWKHIILLKEAEQEKVFVGRDELEKELTRLLSEKNVPYGSYSYILWVQQTFGEEYDRFEKRVENLLRVKKLIDGIMHPPAPIIKEEAAKQKFLNQYNSMATEFVNFPTLEEAQVFYKKITPEGWDKEKIKNPKFSTPTGHISLEAVIDLWQVPTEDAYRIHAMALDQIAMPAKMYKGYGVFRLKEKKDADLTEYTDKKKQEYLKILKQVYYYDKTQKVIQDIFKRANFKDYAHDKILVFETSEGNFEVQLYTQVAPKACENIIGLAGKKYYDGTIFHRVISSFMIQGGDPTGTGRGGESLWGKSFEDEVNDKVQFEKAGILAMANTGPGTNGSQFFITLAPTPYLNKKHTIFGEVISGFEVIQKIGHAETDADNRPKREQKILRLYLKRWPS